MVVSRLLRMEVVAAVVVRKEGRKEQMNKGKEEGRKEGSKEGNICVCGGDIRRWGSRRNGGCERGDGDASSTGRGW